MKYFMNGPVYKFGAEVVRACMGSNRFLQNVERERYRFKSPVDDGRTFREKEGLEIKTVMTPEETEILFAALEMVRIRR